jgi:uncharacterized protein DUF4136
MRRIALCLLLCLAAGLTAAAAGVTVDYDKKADFSKFKTYAWKEGTPAGNPLNEERVHKAVDGQLAAKGLQKTEGEADCYVYTHVKNKASQQVHMDSFGYGGYYGWGGWGGGWGTTTVNVQNVIDGMLIVDIVDASTKELAWRGLGTKTLYPDTKPEKIEKVINKAVSQMFYGFPPKPAEEKKKK